MAPRLPANLIEAANRAEAAALLIRAGYRVFEPEADIEGVGLVVRSPNGQLCEVQLKARPMVSKDKYHGRDIWMLFPDPKPIPMKREWYLAPHDRLFDYAKSCIREKREFRFRTFSKMTKGLREFLNTYKIPHPNSADSIGDERGIAGGGF